MADNKHYILSQLKHKESARFSDLKLPNMSTNAFSYHLKKLVKEGWLKKTEQGYVLGTRGLAYMDREASDKLVRSQPNVTIVLLIQDGYGKVLLKKRAEQPYLSTWGLPAASASVADTSILEAGRWACRQFVKTVPDNIRHVGDCYVRVKKDSLALGSHLNHVIRLELDNIEITDDFMWTKPLDLSQMQLVPGTENIITRAFFNDTFFFEEFTVQLSDQIALDI